MKKVLIIVLILLAINGSLENSYHYKDGSIQIGKNPALKTDGSFSIQDSYHTVKIFGLFIKGTAKTPFSIVGYYQAAPQNADFTEITGVCYRGNTIHKGFSLKGTFKINYSNDYADYTALCENSDTGEQWIMSAHGIASNDIYSPSEAAERAAILLGESTDDYDSADIVNFAVIGYPYSSLEVSCKWYIESFPRADKPMPGFVMVSTNGKRCAILDNEGDKFIHTDFEKGVVTLTPLVLAKNFFPDGFVFVNNTKLKS